MDHPRRRAIALGSGLVLLLAGALASNTALTAWGIAVSTMSVAAMLWARVAWNGVEISVRFYPERVFISERTEVRVHVRNDKRLPIPIMRLGVWLPPELSPIDEAGPPTIRGFRRRLYLPGKAEARLALPIQASRRGEYRLRLIEAELFDPFGLTPLHHELAPPADVVLALDLAVGEPFWDSVYPEIAEDTIGWASVVARQAVASGWRIGLVANAHLSRGRGPIRVLPSSARGNEAALFAAMARMPNEPSSDLAPMLREVGRGLSRTAAVVVISPRPGAWLREEIEVVRRRGLDLVELSPIEARLAEAVP